MIICTFFLTHCSSVQLANLHSSGLCLSEALCRRLVGFFNQMNLREPAPPVSVQPHHRLRHPRLGFPRCARSRWALSQLLSGWLWAVLQRSAGKKQDGAEEVFHVGGLSKISTPILPGEWRGVWNSLSFSFCNCPHWGGFSVYPDSRLYILPFWSVGSCLQQPCPDAVAWFLLHKKLMFYYLSVHASAQGKVVTSGQ